MELPAKPPESVGSAMNYSKSFSLACIAAMSLAVGVADASAQRHGGGGGGGGRSAGHGGGGGGPRGGAVAGPRGGAVAGPRGAVVAGPRGAVAFPRYYGGGYGYYGHARYIHPRIGGFYPYRPYYYPYRPGITVGFYAGFGYGYPYYYGAYPYAYPYYGSYGYPYPYGGYPYAAAGYGAPAPQSYVSAQPGVAYGGIRIEGAPKDAQVFADGNYVGVVEDFDGPVRHLNLPSGSHQIEIRPNGMQPIAFDVNVQAGQTMSVHADAR
jgi:PEGA domain